MFDNKLLPTYNRNFLVILFLVSFTMAGCVPATVKDMTDMPVPVGQSSERIAKAIRMAGVGLGWAMMERAPGLIEGKLMHGESVVKVEIPYTTSSYSINYKDSSADLKYDASTKTIDNDYNRWVRNLNKYIQMQLSLM